MRAVRLVALAVSLGVAGCQTGGPAPVYLDPASNLGVPSGVAPAATGVPAGTPPVPASATAEPAALSRDAQGQPNDEFDGQSWIEYRRSHAVAPPPRLRVRGPARGEVIPLLPNPGEAELDPRMYNPQARR